MSLFTGDKADRTAQGCGMISAGAIVLVALLVIALLIHHC